MPLKPDNYYNYENTTTTTTKTQLLLLLLLQLLLLLLLLGQRERDRRSDVIGDLRARSRLDDEPHRDQRRRWVPRRV